MNLPTIKILGLNVNPLSMDEVIAYINRAIGERCYARILTLNAEIAYLSHADKKLAGIINSAQLVTPDGSGILWASQRYGFPVKERVSGIDLIQRLFAEKENHYRFYFLGAKSEIVAAAAKKMKETYPHSSLVGYHDGYFSDAESLDVAADVKKSGANILLVAMGFPRQDLWIDTYAQDAGISIAIGVGGSFDVLSGNIKRAPVFWQKFRMEWFYRLIKDPRRYKRALNLPKFMSAVKKDIREKKADKQ